MERDSHTPTATVQPQSPEIVTSEMMILRERLARCEMAIQYERQAAQNAFLSLDGRLHALSREMWSRGFGVPLGLSGWVKITLAVLLPFLTLLVTGSLEKAHMVSQMVP